MCPQTAQSSSDINFVDLFMYRLHIFEHSFSISIKSGLERKIRMHGPFSFFSITCKSRFFHTNQTAFKTIQQILNLIKLVSVSIVHLTPEH